MIAALQARWEAPRPAGAKRCRVILGGTAWPELAGRMSFNHADPIVEAAQAEAAAGGKPRAEADISDADMAAQLAASSAPSSSKRDLDMLNSKVTSLRMQKRARR